MPLLQLIGRLGLDTSNYDANIKKSEATIAAFGNKFRRSIVGTVGSFFTLGYAVNFVQERIRALEGTAEKMEIPEGTLSDEIQAQEAAIRGMEKQFDLGKRLEKLKKELGELEDQNNLKAMSDEERRLELLRRYQILTNQIRDDFLAGKLDSEETLKRRVEAEQLKSKIQQIQFPKDEMILKQEVRARSLGLGPGDPLARMGGFTGGNDVKIITTLERTARATEETADNTAGNSVRFR